MIIRIILTISNHSYLTILTTGQTSEVELNKISYNVKTTRQIA